MTKSGAPSPLQIFDASVLVRAGKATVPDAYIDMQTRMLSMMNVFYTPNIDTITLLRIDFDMTTSRILAKADIRHYPSLPVDATPWNAINISAIAVVSVMILFTAGEKIVTTLCSKTRPSPPHRRAARSTYGHKADSLLGLLMGAFLITQSVMYNATR